MPSRSGPIHGRLAAERPQKKKKKISCKACEGVFDTGLRMAILTFFGTRYVYGYYNRWLTPTYTIQLMRALVCWSWPRMFALLVSVPHHAYRECLHNSQSRFILRNRIGTYVPGTAYQVQFLLIIRAKRVSNCYMQEKKNWPFVCPDVRIISWF